MLPKNGCEAGNNNIRLDLKNSILNQVEDGASPDLETAIDFSVWEFEGQTQAQVNNLICLIFGTDLFYNVDEVKFKRYRADVGYGKAAIGEYGQKLLTGKTKYGFNVRIILPGTWLSVNHDAVSYCELANRLVFLGGKITRADANVTDYQKRVDWQDMFEAVDSGKFTGVKRKKIILSGELEENDGGTIYLGTRQSDAFTRIYETYRKHGRLGTRYESQLQSDKARKFNHDLLEKYRYEKANIYLYHKAEKARELLEITMSRWIASRAVGQFDFIDRSQKYKNGSLEKCQRLPWWQKFLDIIGEAVRIKVKQAKSSLASKHKWMSRQVSGTLAILYHGLGPDKFYDLIENYISNRESKLSDEDKFWIEILKEKGFNALGDNLLNC